MNNKSKFEPLVISIESFFCKSKILQQGVYHIDKCTYMHHKIYLSIFSKQLRISYKTVYMNICLHLHTFARTRA